jgi:hypothetical protein
MTRQGRHIRLLGYNSIIGTWHNEQLLVHSSVVLYRTLQYHAENKPFLSMCWDFYIYATIWIIQTWLMRTMIHFAKLHFSFISWMLNCIVDQNIQLWIKLLWSWKGEFIFQLYIPKKQMLQCKNVSIVWCDLLWAYSWACTWERTGKMQWKYYTSDNVTGKVEGVGHGIYLDNSLSSPDLFNGMHTGALSCCGSETES